ncbi:hypothetical protein EJ06DRAFT_529183 [Trichodelitschia bisporula]|uniref:Uncharacterized protein n=1 Tax=Trichodelitschia bisporula TaxID=703511 RepID=A0A6G1I1R0_9PEZI|nr:hypothetical protein EJ06DRAFT_529183 [Trichodelitschia bisporula]
MVGHARLNRRQSASKPLKRLGKDKEDNRVARPSAVYTTVVPYRLPLSWPIPALRPGVDPRFLPSSQIGPFQNTNDTFRTHECLENTYLDVIYSYPPPRGSSCHSNKPNGLSPAPSNSSADLEADGGTDSVSAIGWAWKMQEVPRRHFDFITWNRLKSKNVGRVVASPSSVVPA